MTTKRCSISWLLLLLLAITWAAAAAAAAVEEQVCGADDESCDATNILGTDGEDNLAASPVCVNDSDRCDYWATAGECEANPRYMRVSCAKSCRVCKEHKE
jgi:hypothetical protein